MEEPREPQQQVVTPINYQSQPIYPATQPPYYLPAPTVGRFARFRRLMRLLVRRMLYGSVKVGRVIRPYAGFVVVLIALLGVIGWMSYLLWGPKEVAPTFARADSLPPASAIEIFIKGQQSFNADMMWDAYSTDYQASQLASGASKATLQAQANSQRTMGLQFVHYDYIGGVKVEDGSMYFYSVDLKLRDQQARLPMIFRADADGKITGIDSPLTRSSSGNSQ